MNVREVVRFCGNLCKNIKVARTWEIFGPFLADDLLESVSRSRSMCDRQQGRHETVFFICFWIFTTLWIFGIVVRRKNMKKRLLKIVWQRFSRANVVWSIYYLLGSSAAQKCYHGFHHKLQLSAAGAKRKSICKELCSRCVGGRRVILCDGDYSPK